MKTKFSQVLDKNMCVISSALALIALLVTTLSANTTCLFIAHQPELPKSAKKLRKF